MSQIYGSNFIQQIIEQDIADGLDPRSIVLRFPPEPNGFLHIGHARAICLNFGLAQRYGGKCYLRFDDTNPSTENEVFVEQIKKDIRWLGFEWDALHFTSEYFPQLYDYTLRLIEKGLAYIDDQSPEAVRRHRGTLSEPGVASPYRDRSTRENLALFAEMKRSKQTDLPRVVRARIDMAAQNLNMRDPIIWRQRKEEHHRLGSEWTIFPMYDFAHCLSDAIEGIVYSLCTLEFADHRPLYNWFLEHLVDGPLPRQIEFGRMNIDGVVTSKRQLAKLHADGVVEALSDPRLMTLSGLRNRGFTSEIIRDFCFRTPISRAQGDLELSYFHSVAREVLNASAPRAMAVLRPLKVVIENIEPKDKVECRSYILPKQPEAGTRRLNLSREIFIEADDFRLESSKDFFRLTPEQSVRLRSAGILHCVGVVRDDDGQIIELRARLELDSLANKRDDQGKKVRATIHWVEAASALPAQIALYEDESHQTEINALSDDNNVDEPKQTSKLCAPEKLTHCLLEESLRDAPTGVCYQFERLGYFCRQEASGNSWIRTLRLRSTI